MAVQKNEFSPSVEILTTTKHGREGTRRLNTRQCAHDVFPQPKPEHGELGARATACWTGLIT
eukprot:1160606-Pelagomonas_calceolata.AAC.2